MFIKGPCEEIVDNKSLKLVISDFITDFYVKNRHIRFPLIYFDAFSSNEEFMKSRAKYVLIRVHDSIDHQTYYIVSLYDHDDSYDKDFIKFLLSAAQHPRYSINTYYTNCVTFRKHDTSKEIIFNIDLEKPISKEYLMNRDYRITCNLMDNVSLLADYREELNTLDQEG